MLITTVNLGETSIEFHNALWGKETVKVNGEVVSSKFSAAGMEHVFTVKEGEKEVNYKLQTGTGMLGLTISLYRNDLPVIQSPRTKGWVKFVVIAIILFALGAIIGDLFFG